ncbi:hypothetical protein WJX73_007525 [Symbiochloris irregularis]|uniref:Flavanone 4-reductase n=1 Tax=Symbiochloris irregularis TaxID=706552 RepID=A0AAW1PJX6_9CHLO
MQVAVVTGASGYIAVQLVKQLLEKGYIVRGTVRSTKDTAKTEILTQLAGVLPGRLELHEADLLQEGSFDDVVQGADYVFHTASPVIKEPEDAQRDVIDPALNGTKNVLASVIKHKSGIKRVVMTSSVVAVSDFKSPPKNGSAFTEDDWAENSSLADPYRHSKVLAERHAWKVAEEQGFELVTILPTWVLGPILGTRLDSLSMLKTKDFVEGKSDELYGRMVDVRDVARAHILAAELPHAHGRYIVTDPHGYESGEFWEALNRRFPGKRYPSKPYKAGKNVIDISKATKDLGLTFISGPEVVCDAAGSLFAAGLAKPPDNAST